MESLSLVKQFLDIIFSGEDIEKLRDFMTDDFTFNGPLYEFDSVESYLQSLRSDPFKNATYNIIEEFENNNSVCLVYKFLKPGFSTTMAQLFEIQDDKISSVLLIFDTNKLLSKK